MITGDGDRYEKWLGFAETMPYLIGNPFYAALSKTKVIIVDSDCNINKIVGEMK